MIRTWAVLCLLAAPAAAAAPDRHVLPAELVDAPCVVLYPQTGTATVYLAGGPQTGKIGVVLAGDSVKAAQQMSPTDVAARTNATVDGTCAVVDITGKTVTPGLIDVGTQLGLVEVSLEEATRNADDRGPPTGANLRVSDGYDPASTLIPVARIEGVTSAVINPSGGRLAGLAAFVDLAGSTQADAVVDETVAMVASIGGPSRAGALRDLRALLEDARLYARNRAAFERRATRDYAADHRDLEALQPVVRGEIPLVIGADRASDIEALLRLATEQRVALVIRGGAEAWRHAAALAEADVSVIVDPMVYGPGGFAQRAGRPDNAALLHEAGVPVILSTFSSHNARLLRQQAGNAVRGGLDHDAAIEAITATPARVFGQPKRGTLNPGQIANVVLWDGDPLELSTSVAGVWIGGRATALDSRQWRLFLSYETLPGTPVPALSLPADDN